MAQLENAYWDLSASQRNVAVARESLKASEELLSDSQKQFQVGTMSRLDVVTAESQVASSQRDLIVAQTALEQQQTILKQLVSKIGDPALDAAATVLTDPLPEPQESDLPPLDQALSQALANRRGIASGTVQSLQPGRGDSLYREQPAAQHRALRPVCQFGSAGQHGGRHRRRAWLAGPVLGSCPSGNRHRD